MMRTYYDILQRDEFEKYLEMEGVAPSQLERNPYSLDLEDLKYAFKNVMSLAESFGEIQSLKGDNWQLIKYDLLELYLSEKDSINQIRMD